MKYYRPPQSKSPDRSLRLFIVFFILGLGLLGLIGRLVDLNVFNRVFLLKQSDARILRKIIIPAYRGIIVDRLGEPLAISTPVDSVWVDPQIFNANPQEMQQLANLLEMSAAEINDRIHKSTSREFLYLKRRLPPPVTEQIQALKIPGLFLQHEYKRYYPEGEVAAHVVGTTNVDDHGQEGLELSYDQWLSGVSGEKEVFRDRLGRIISEVASLRTAQQGQNLVLSLDHRIQYAAYRALMEAMQNDHAASGSVVVLNAKTGEILAMVNQPSYNPNGASDDKDGRYRNRAVTDSYEPGSVIKPFTIALALESGKYTPDSKIDTTPGWMVIGGFKIEDDTKNGVINLTQLLQKSSNIGAAKIMLSLQPQNFWNLLSRIGFGQSTNSGYPGEQPGRLVVHPVWYPSEIAALAYGYGIAVTPLQLAQAYDILASDGMKKPVTFLKIDAPPPSVSVITPDAAHEVLTMLEAVVTGAATRAEVPGYRVAGKTGTAYIAGPNGYDKHRYDSSFVGIAPVSDPQLVVAITIRDPQGFHFGAEVAAPVFSKVMGSALRIMNIPPDNLKPQSLN